MKLSAISLSLATVFALPATAATVYQDEANKFEIGGRIEVRGNVSDANKKYDDMGKVTDDSSYDDKSRVRLDIRGSHQYSHDLSFFARYEFEAKEKTDGGSDDATINTRHLYVGADTLYGSLSYGHLDNSVTYLTDWTDNAQVFSGYINEYNVATADRAKSSVLYSYDFDGGMLDGLLFRASGVFNSDQQSDGGSAMLAYALPYNFEVGVGYAYSEQEYGAGSDTYDSDSIIAALRYVNGGINIAAMYMGGSISADGIKDSDFDAVDAYVGYTFGQTNLNLTYNKYKADDIDALNIDSIGIEAGRYIGPVTAYVAYKFNNLDSNEGGIGDNNEDEFMFGAKYVF